MNAPGHPKYTLNCFYVSIRPTTLRINSLLNDYAPEINLLASVLWPNCVIFICIYFYLIRIYTTTHYELYLSKSINHVKYEVFLILLNLFLINVLKYYSKYQILVKVLFLQCCFFFQVFPFIVIFFIKRSIFGSMSFILNRFWSILIIFRGNK